MNILVVDDEKEIADLVEICLVNEGFSVYKYYNGQDAIRCIQTTTLDMAILDVNLPDMSGFDICKYIREDKFYPVIMLTAKIEENDKIMGLTLGADDYITKPFTVAELVTRIKAQLRRYTFYNPQPTSAEHVTTEFDIRGLHISNETHKCFLYGEEIILTPIEFKIIWYLCAHQGKVVSAEELFETVWKEKYFESNNTIMAHIARLRGKLKEPPRKPKFIKTVWGVGYTIENH